MNLFITDPCPVQAARNMDDQRIVNHCRECAQIVTTALAVAGGQYPFPRLSPHPEAAPKPSHLHHPVPHWVAATSGNYEWTVRHLEAIHIEYTERYDKRHIYNHLIPQYEDAIDFIPDGPLQDFQNSAANETLRLDFTHIAPVVDAYRVYMTARWCLASRPPRWNRDPLPLLFGSHNWSDMNGWGKEKDWPEVTNVTRYLLKM